MRRTLRLLATVAPVLAALVLVATACTSAPAAPATDEITIAPAGERAEAPTLKGELLDGSGSFDLAQHAGDVVVVNFWGSWCPPCVAEADDLEQAYKSTKDSGVTFLGVNIRDDRDAAQRFASLRNTYPSVFDPSSRLALAFAVPPVAIPTTIVIDRQGRIAATANRPLLRSELEPAIVALAGESR